MPDISNFSWVGVAQCRIVGFSLVIACLLGIAVSAQESDLAAEKSLYQDNCSTCHSIIASDARDHFPGEPMRQLVQAGIMPSVAPHWALTSGISVSASRRHAMRHPSAPV